MKVGAGYEDAVLAEISLTEAGLTESLGERSLAVVTSTHILTQLTVLLSDLPVPPQPLAGGGTGGLGRCLVTLPTAGQHLLVLVVEPGRDVRHVHEDAHRDVEVAGGGRRLPVRPYVGQRVVPGHGAPLWPLSTTT